MRKNRDFCNRNKLLPQQLRPQARRGEAKIGGNTEKSKSTTKSDTQKPPLRPKLDLPAANLRAGPRKTQIFRVFGSIPRRQPAPPRLAPAPGASRLFWDARTRKSAQNQAGRALQTPKFPLCHSPLPLGIFNPHRSLFPRDFCFVSLLHFPFFLSFFFGIQTPAQLSQLSQRVLKGKKG